MSLVSALAQHDHDVDHCPHEGLIYFFSGMLADTMLCSDACDWTIYRYKTTCRHWDSDIPAHAFTSYINFACS